MKASITHIPLTAAILGGLAGASFLSPPALAAPSAPPGPPQPAAAPMVAMDASAQDAVNRSVTVLTDDDGREVKVVLEDGEYTIWVDGEKVRSGDFSDAPRVMSIEKDGEAVAVLRRTGDAAYNVRFAGDEREVRERAARELRRSLSGLEGRERALTALRLQPGDDDEVRVIAEIAHEPKVMMGVTMEELPESLAAQLDLDAVGATLLTGVLDGLPAQKAGLRMHDVIVGVSGIDGASPADIRKRLRDLKPGDELKFRVLRSGRERDITLKLEAFNPEALGIAPNVVRRWGEDRSFPSGEEVAPKAPILEVEQYLRKMQESFEQQFDSDEFDAYFGELSRLLEDIEVQFEQEPGRFTFDVEIPGLQQKGAGAISIFPEGEVFSGEDFQVFIPGEDGEARAITIPRTPNPPGLPGHWRAESGTSVLTERMDAIDARLDRIESMLERLLHERGDDSH
ncbi:PDZ domain-containing protein [Pyruvatibacter sp.]|uniref:PDZ domain-containing protein n=1 Tax=Pyruvatibacter sp. TaxID=1981328 RepID=UPI0032F04A36